jgi:hypothetical protein
MVLVLEGEGRKEQAFAFRKESPKGGWWRAASRFHVILNVA